MKVKIVKPLPGSGYFPGEEFTTDTEGLERARKLNVVEVLEEQAAVIVEAETRKKPMPKRKAGRSK